MVAGGCNASVTGRRCWNDFRRAFLSRRRHRHVTSPQRRVGIPLGKTRSKGDRMLRTIHFVSAGAVAGALLLAADAPARKPKPVPCPPGRYLVTQGADALVADSAPAPAEVLVQGRQIALGTHCALRAATVRATRRGTKLAAQWPSFGTLRRCKRAATISGGCSTMVGKVKAKGLKAEPFTATLAPNSTTTTTTPTTTTSSEPTRTTSTTTTSTTATTAPACPPTTTSTTLPGLCGNRTVDPGETCDDGAANGTPGDPCPGNCVIAACTPVIGSSRTFTVTYTAPAGKQVAGLTVFVDYPEGQVIIHGSGNQASVLASISKLPSLPFEPTGHDHLRGLPVRQPARGERLHLHRDRRRGRERRRARRRHLHRDVALSPTAPLRLRRHPAQVARCRRRADHDVVAHGVVLALAQEVAPEEVLLRVIRTRRHDPLGIVRTERREGGQRLVRRLVRVEDRGHRCGRLPVPAAGAARKQDERQADFPGHGDTVTWQLGRSSGGMTPPSGSASSTTAHAKPSAATAVPGLQSNRASSKPYGPLSVTGCPGGAATVVTSIVSVSKKMMSPL